MRHLRKQAFFGVFCVLVLRFGASPSGDVLLGCAGTRATPSPTPAPTVDASGSLDAGAPVVTNEDASLEELRRLLAASPVTTIEQFVLEPQKNGGNGAPNAVSAPGRDATTVGGTPSWNRDLTGPTCLRLAASGAAAITVDGKLLQDTTSPAKGALVPSDGVLCVRGGSLRVVGSATGRVVIAFTAP